MQSFYGWDACLLSHAYNMIPICMTWIFRVPLLPCSRYMIIYYGTCPFSIIASCADLTMFLKLSQFLQGKCRSAAYHYKELTSSPIKSRLAYRLPSARAIIVQSAEHASKFARVPIQTFVRVRITFAIVFIIIWHGHSRLVRVSEGQNSRVRSLKQGSRSCRRGWFPFTHRCPTFFGATQALGWIP